MVRPIVEYASTVWDPYETSHIKAIEGVQRKAARFVSGNFSRESSVTTMINTLQWRSLQERRCVARLAMLHKTIHHQSATLLPPETSFQRTSLRGQHPHSLRTIRATTDSYLYSFFPRTIRCWNLLPPAVATANTSSGLKTTLMHGLNTGTISISNPRDMFSRPRLGSNPALGHCLFYSNHVKLL